MGRNIKLPTLFHGFRYERCGFLWRKVKVVEHYRYSSDITLGIFNSMKEAQIFVKLML